MAMKEVGSSDFTPTWNFEENGSRIDGKYVGKKDGIGKWKKSIYQIDTKDGLYEVWGSTVLDNKMKEVEIGSVVQIEYNGQLKGKNGSYHDYAVLYDDGT